MGLEECLRREAEVQRTGRGHLQAIVVDRDTDGALAARVVSVADRVGDRFAERERRICRFVDPFHPTRLEVAGDGHVVQKESLRALEEIERMAMELAVVEELALLRSPEARHSEETLGEVGQEPVRTAEEHDRGGAKSVLPQAQATQGQPEAALRSGCAMLYYMHASW